MVTVFVVASCELLFEELSVVVAERGLLAVVEVEAVALLIFEGGGGGGALEPEEGGGGGDLFGGLDAEGTDKLEEDKAEEGVVVIVKVARGESGGGGGRTSLTGKTSVGGSLEGLTGL